MPVDTRTRAQKIGEPEDSGPIRPIRHTVAQLTALEKAEKAFRASARHIFAEKAEELTHALIQIATDPTEKTNSRLEALKLCLQFALGRPSTVHVNEDGAPATPIFNIKIGENANSNNTAISAKFEKAAIEAADLNDQEDHPDD